MRDSHTRSFIKGISWRVAGTLATTLLVFIFTGNFRLSLGVGALEFILKIFLFYIHERAWHSISWGKIIKDL